MPRLLPAAVLVLSLSLAPVLLAQESDHSQLPAASPLEAPQPLFDHLTVQDGLAQGTVPARAQQSVPAHEQPSSSGPDTAPASIRFERLTAEDGLSSQMVFAMTQDQRGFMWFSILSGFTRYDGYSFTQ